MSLPSIVQPLIIVGPAIVVWNGYSYYFESGVKSQYERETFDISDDFAGDLDTRHKSAKTVISGKPVGMVKYLTTSSGISAMMPYKPSQVGSSILGTTGSPLSVVIHTQFGGASNTGQTITYVRGGMTKLPTINLGSQKTLYGDIEFTCIGNPVTAALTSGAWQAIADSAFADTTYDDSQIITDIYTAGWGSSPYAAIGSHNGFEIDVPLKINEIRSDDYGITDLIIDSLSPATCKFAPSSLTEAQLWTMLNAQGSSVIQPGMSLGNAAQALTIGGTGNGAHTLAVSIANAGPKSAGFTYDKKNNRIQEIMFTSRRTWTAGVPNANITFTVT